jgi:hypothetical protein
MTLKDDISALIVEVTEYSENPDEVLDTLLNDEAFQVAGITALMFNSSSKELSEEEYHEALTTLIQITGLVIIKLRHM